MYSTYYQAISPGENEYTPKQSIGMYHQGTLNATALGV